MIKQEQLRKKLASVSIDHVAKTQEFSKRSDGKIKPLEFVLSFFVSIQSTHHTLKNWGMKLSLMLQQALSYNGIKNAQNQSRADFAKALLEKVITQRIDTWNSPLMKTRLFEQFNRVFLEDSTCIKLPAYLHQFFPGAFSKTGKTATAKIQLRQELKSGEYTHFDLQSFRDNDQKFSPEILKELCAGDLIIRDLGYWALAVFQQIIDLKAFFVSRLRFGVNLYTIDTGQQINLAKILRKARKSGQSIVELEVLVGSQAKVKSRVVAIRCPPQVTRKKRKAARNNRSAKANHSDEYMELLGWTIFFTNVPPAMINPSELLQVYGYRWRIEIIFKCWKSHFKIDHLFNTQTKLTKQQVEITFYLFMVWLTLFFARMYAVFLHKVYIQKGKFLSIMKFAKFIKEHLSALLADPDSNFWIDYLAYYCTYKKRKDTSNFCEQFYLLI